MDLTSDSDRREAFPVAGDETAVRFQFWRRLWITAVLGIIFIAGLLMILATQGSGIQEAVEQAGGRYQCHDSIPMFWQVTNYLGGGRSTKVHTIHFTPGQVSDDWLRRHHNKLAKLTHWTLELRRTQVTDSGVASLVDLTELQTLSLRGTSLTDRSLEAMNQLPSVVVLDISGTGITGEGLARLNRTSWTRLTIDASQLTDSGWQYLSSLTSLNGLGVYGADDHLVASLDKIPFQISLQLEGTQITSDSVPALKNLITAKGLVSLVLLDVSLTEEDLRQLKQASPGCHIYSTTSEGYERLMDQSRIMSSTSLF